MNWVKLSLVYVIRGKFELSIVPRYLIIAVSTGFSNSKSTLIVHHVILILELSYSLGLAKIFIVKKYIS